MEIFALLIAVVLGILLVILIKPNHQVISFLLTFSGAYLLSITLLKFFPEIYNDTQGQTIGMYVILGILIQVILDYFSKGAEHGHYHSQGTSLFPWVLFISLNIHAFMEGLPLSGHRHDDLLWAIVIHKIPITMVLVTNFIHRKINKTSIIFFILIFALMTPLATILDDKISFLITYRNEINAIVAGTFLHIATIILFESSQINHRFNMYKFLSLIFGISLALLVK